MVLNVERHPLQMCSVLRFMYTGETVHGAESWLMAAKVRRAVQERW